MKTAAVLLLLTSTAFAAQQRPTVSKTMVPETAATTQTQAPQQAKKKPAPQAVAKQPGRQVNPLAIQQQRKQVVIENGPQNPHRMPHAALMTNAKPVLPPKAGPFEIKAQLRNIMTLANGEELQNVGGKNFGLSTEARLGLKHESGFGVTATGTYQTNNFADNAANTGSNGDASLMLHHPSIVKYDNVNLMGYARVYFPTSEKSHNNDIRTAAYYSILDVELGGKWSMETLGLIRGFWRPSYANDDLQSFFFADHEFYYKLTDWMSPSIGVQYEADNTYAMGMNQEIDLYPFVDFQITPNVLFEPKFYFPLYTNGQGSVNSKGAALNQGYAEFFLKLSI